MTSRGPRWLAAVLGASLCALLAGFASAQDAWHTMTGPERSFIVELPAAPKYTPMQVATAAGVAYTMHQYHLEQGPAGYVVQFVSYPKDVNLSNPQTVLQSSLDRTAKSMEGGKWSSVDWVKQQGSTAVDTVGVKGSSEIRSYSVLKGRQLITLLHIGAPGSARTPDVERFVASLKVAP